MSYTPTTFVDGTDPAITAAELNKIGTGISAAHTAVQTVSDALANTVPTSVITTRGDLLVGGTGGTPIRLAAGTNGLVLTADSTQTGGLRWTAASYAKPSGGIPSTDLTSAVQAALSAAATAYQKPGTGIPQADLSAAVQGQLGGSGGGTGITPGKIRPDLTKTGIVIPMYIYPANVFTNTVYNALCDLKRLYHDVPVYAIINPSSGPGTVMDGNYRTAIRRLRGAGITTLAYVPAGYGPAGATGHTARTLTQVETDITTWQSFYPEVDGLFIDEMASADNSTSANFYSSVTDYAHTLGLYPVVGNPGTAIPTRYFTTLTADCILVYENPGYPTESNLKGDYDGGYIDSPYWKRGALVYSATSFDATQFAMMTKYTGMVYVTPSDASWGTVSSYMTQMLNALSSATVATTGGGSSSGGGTGGSGTTSDGTVTSTVGDLV